jgi:hypothetical protein
MENENLRGRFYFSQKAFDSYREYPNKGERETFARLDSGETVRYTEMVSDGGEPLSQFDDLVYLGEGEFSHFGDVL